MSPFAKGCSRCGRIIYDGKRCKCKPPSSSKVTSGYAHQKRREQLEATLPQPCFFCGVQVQSGEPFDAHHVTGTSGATLAVAHPRCNRRAGAEGDDGPPPEALGGGARPWVGTDDAAPKPEQESSSRPWWAV